MERSFARIGFALGLYLSCASIFAGEAGAQLSGLFQSAPGAVATYTYHDGTFQTVTLPVDLTVSFSVDNATSALAATIHRPIIGAAADGTPIYPIATYFPMRVTGNSSNGRDFYGNLLDTQYLFEWEFRPLAADELLLSGHVFWAGGRYEETTITSTRLIPAVAGDYNRDGTVNAADYAVWRKNEGTTDTLPNDLIGGTIGPPHYELWRTHFGQTNTYAAPLGNPSSSAIPEPATVSMLFIVLLALSARRRIV